MVQGLPEHRNQMRQAREKLPHRGPRRRYRLLLVAGPEANFRILFVSAILLDAEGALTDR